MKTCRHLALLSFFVLIGASTADAQQAKNVPSTQAPAGSSASQDEIATKAEAYFDFVMGHYFAQEYQITSRSEDANKAIDSFKKAFTLDPSSQQIGDELAEIYYQSQRVRDAVIEAQSILAKDPDNLPARRLLARIYVRLLGDLSNTSGQRDTLVHATEQYREILRLDPTDTEAALWLARLYRLQNEQDEAQGVLQTLLAREPANENGVEQLTQLLLDEGKSQEAVSSLQSILQRAPTPRLWELLGDAYNQIHDLPNAEQAYRKASEAQPDDINHRKELAQTLLAEEKFPEALEMYQRLAQMDADDPDNYLRLAEIYRQLKQLDKAEQNVLLAKQRAPNSLEVTYYEASIYEDEGRFDDSIRVLSEAVTAVKTESEFTPARRRTLAILYQQLGQLYRETGNYTAAVNTFEEMLRLGAEEDRRARVMIIDTYRDARDISKALDAAHKAADTYPKDRSILIAQALLFGENAQADQAVSQLRALLDGSPADFEIQLDIAQVDEESKRWADAEEAIHAAEKLQPGSSGKEMTGFLLGAIFERQKKFDLAEEEFRKVLAANPRNTSTLNYYGYMLADRGVRLDEATDLIKRALADDPNNAAYEDSLGWAYFKQNKLDEAEDLLHKAATRESHDPTILSHLGDVYAKMGKDSLAEAQWQKSLDEWHRVLPAEFEPAKMTEVEQKISALKRRLAQQKTPTEPKP
ncbi:MAG TPA: tetratricopeptide repeat protein [Candidatus Acidoferrales bacterium]|jgi:tetratricopeptide (TPR) repeat protein|nr:tetratricopeptide repeat protein [Candidatus Acidoferrales bacterium]